MGIIIYRDSIQGKRLLGRIDYEREHSSAFQYDEQYLARAQVVGELGVSELLPLDDEPYSSADFAPFFRGLLPEGETYEELINMYQLPRNDYLSMLERLGCESIGALTFVSERADPGGYIPKYVPLGTDRVESLREFPAREVLNTVSETRLSLSGAQSKVAWFLPDGKDAATASVEDWMVPEGTAPSTHIIKLSRKGEEEIAVNELACSNLSAACGFPTAEATLIPDIAGAIAVKRYDRLWVNDGSEKRLLRLHQEDFCQALGLAPYQKYQEYEEGDYLCRIAMLLESASDNPIADKQEFAKRLLFNYVIGNSDAHLKNSSLLYNKEWTGRRLAPMYDITCIPLTGYSTRMPFDIGEHRVLAEIEEKDLMSIPLDLDIPLDTFNALSAEVISALETYDVQADDPQVADTIERIMMNAKPRMDVVKCYLGFERRR